MVGIDTAKYDEEYLVSNVLFGSGEVVEDASRSVQLSQQRPNSKAERNGPLVTSEASSDADFGVESDKTVPVERFDSGTHDTSAWNETVNNGTDSTGILNQTLQQNIANVSYTNTTKNSTDARPEYPKEVWIMMDRNFNRLARMGNRIWNYASTLGIYYRAKEDLFPPDTIVRIVRSKRHAIQEHAHMFRHSLPDIVGNKNNVTVAETKFSTFTDFDLKNACKNARGSLCHINIAGYLQSYRYWDGYEKEIRDRLEFSDAVKSTVESIWTNFSTKLQPSAFLVDGTEDDNSNHEANGSKTNMTIVGVHVRRGDMTQRKESATLQFYTSAFEHFRTKYESSSVRFIVGSDDKDWCESTFRPWNDVFVTPHNLTAEVDFALLALQSDHFIVSDGTYGWLAAFLAGGDVVYHGVSEAYKHSAISNYRNSDYFPPHWVVIEDQ